MEILMCNAIVINNSIWCVYVKLYGDSMKLNEWVRPLTIGDEVEIMDSEYHPSKVGRTGIVICELTDNSEYDFEVRIGEEPFQYYKYELERVGGV